MLSTLRAAVALLGLILVGSPLVAQPGRLVIVGGGLSDTNSTVYRAIIDARQGTGPICVLPTAGATPDSAMDGPVRTFERHGGPGVARGVLISVKRPETARAPETVAQLRTCGGFFFIGGVQSRVTAALRPDGQTTPALEAIRQRWREGAVISGSSAGAAIMSDPMIASGTSAGAFTRGLVRLEGAAADDDSTAGMVISRGLGFFPAALADQHFLARGRFGRLLIALQELTPFDLAFGIDENTALQVDGGTVQAVGASAVTVFDAKGATRTTGGLRGVTMHVMGAGDRFSLTTRRYTAAADKAPRTPTAATVAADTSIFAPWAFLRALDALSQSTQSRLTWSVAGGTITLEKQTDFRATTRAGVGVRGAALGLGITGLRIDMTRQALAR